MKYLEFIQFYFNLGLRNDEELYQEYLDIVKKSHPNTKADCKNFFKCLQEIKVQKIYMDSIIKNLDFTVKSQENYLLVRDMKEKISELKSRINLIKDNLVEIEVDMDEEFKTRLYTSTSLYNIINIIKLDDLVKDINDLQIEITNTYDNL